MIAKSLRSQSWALSDTETEALSQPPSLAGSLESSILSSIATDVGAAALDKAIVYLPSSHRTPLRQCRRPTSTHTEPPIERFLQDEDPMPWLTRIWDKEFHVNWPWGRNGYRKEYHAPVRLHLQSEPIKESAIFDESKDSQLKSYLPIESQKDVIAFPARAPVPGENKPWDLASGRETTRPQTIVSGRISKAIVTTREQTNSQYRSTLESKQQHKSALSFLPPAPESFLRPLPSNSSSPEQFPTELSQPLECEKSLPQDCSSRHSLPLNHTGPVTANDAKWSSSLGINPAYTLKSLSKHDPFYQGVPSDQAGLTTDQTTTFQVSIRGDSHPQDKPESNPPSLMYDSSGTPEVSSSTGVSNTNDTPTPLALLLLPPVPQFNKGQSISEVPESEAFPFSEFVNLEGTV